MLEVHFFPMFFLIPNMESNIINTLMWIQMLWEKVMLHKNFNFLWVAIHNLLYQDVIWEILQHFTYLGIRKKR